MSNNAHIVTRPITDYKPEKKGLSDNTGHPLILANHHFLWTYSLGYYLMICCVYDKLGEVGVLICRVYGLHSQTLHSPY